MKTEDKQIKFEAELTELKVRKTTSGDKEFKLVLITDDPVVLELQQAIADSILKITVHE